MKFVFAQNGKSHNFQRKKLSFFEFAQLEINHVIQQPSEAD
jgi:hypothetical protein